MSSDEWSGNRISSKLLVQTYSRGKKTLPLNPKKKAGDKPGLQIKTLKRDYFFLGAFGAGAAGAGLLASAALETLNSSTSKTRVAPPGIFGGAPASP